MLLLPINFWERGASLLKDLNTLSFPTCLPSENVTRNLISLSFLTKYSLNDGSILYLRSKKSNRLLTVSKPSKTEDFPDPFDPINKTSLDVEGIPSIVKSENRLKFPSSNFVIRIYQIYKG
jgi:hypothetical protein